MGPRTGSALGGVPLEGHHKGPVTVPQNENANVYPHMKDFGTMPSQWRSRKSTVVKTTKATAVKTAPEFEV